MTKARIVTFPGIFGCRNLDNERRYARDFLKQVQECIISHQGCQALPYWERRLPVALELLTKIEAEIVEFDKNNS